MGVVKNVGFNKFPRQRDIGTRLRVCFNYDTTKTIGGEIVRNDRTEPWVQIFKLDDGRYVLSDECQYQYANTPPSDNIGEYNH